MKNTKSNGAGFGGDGEAGMGLLPVLMVMGFVGALSGVFMSKFATRFKSQRHYETDSELGFIKSYLSKQIHCSTTLSFARQAHGVATNQELCDPNANRYFQLYRGTLEGTPIAYGVYDAALPGAYKVGSWRLRAKCMWDPSNPSRTTFEVRAALPLASSGSSDFKPDPLNPSAKLDWSNSRLVLFGDPTADPRNQPLCADSIPKSGGNTGGALLGYAVDYMSSRTRLEKDEQDDIFTALKSRCTSDCNDYEKNIRGPKELAGFQQVNPGADIDGDTRRSDYQMWPPEKNYVDFDLPPGTSTVELNTNGQYQGSGDADNDVSSGTILVSIASSTLEAGTYWGSQMIKIGSAYHKSRSVRFLPTPIGSGIADASIRTVKSSGEELQWFAGLNGSNANTNWTKRKFSLPKVDCISANPCTRIRYYERIPSHNAVPYRNGDIKNSGANNNTGKNYWWFAVTAKFYGQ